MVKQGCILKHFKDLELVFEAAFFTELTVYFKINMYTFIRKYPVFGRPALSSHYFQNNFRSIKSVFKENTALFKT